MENFELKENKLINNKIFEKGTSFEIVQEKSEDSIELEKSIFLEKDVILKKGVLLKKVEGVIQESLGPGGNTLAELVADILLARDRNNPKIAYGISKDIGGAIVSGLEMYKNQRDESFYNTALDGLTDYFS